LVSVIVPTLDEAHAIGRLLDSLAQQAGPFEIVVVDGGSSDGTVEIARARENVRVATGTRGRAAQMNRGAELAGGEVLWFLHADCVAPPGALTAVREALDDSRVAVGAFRFRLDGDRWGYRVLELGVRLRVDLFRLPFGDQGLFVRAEDFARVGGYEAIPLFEDVRLVRALRRVGRLAIVPMPLSTSPRRWERKGLLRTTLQHWQLMLLEKMGRTPEELARLRHGSASQEKPP
jgi:hypothetical protein